MVRSYWVGIRRLHWEAVMDILLEMFLLYLERIIFHAESNNLGKLNIFELVHQHDKNLYAMQARHLFPDAPLIFFFPPKQSLG